MVPTAKVSIEVDRLLDLAAVCEERALREPAALEWLSTFADNARLSWVRWLREDRLRRITEHQQREAQRALVAAERAAQLSARLASALARRPDIATWRVYFWRAGVICGEQGAYRTGQFFAAFNRRLDLYTLLRPDVPSTLRLAWSPGADLSDGPVTALEQPENICYTVPVHGDRAREPWAGRWYFRPFAERGPFVAAASEPDTGAGSIVPAV